MCILNHIGNSDHKALSIVITETKLLKTNLLRVLDFKMLNMAGDNLLTKLQGKTLNQNPFELLIQEINYIKQNTRKVTC